jgi:hypothetical protein
MKAPTKTPMTDQRKAAVIIGKAILQAQLAAASPQSAADEIRTQLRDKWKDNRQAYVRLGNSIVRKLEHAGFALTPAPGTAPRAPAKGKA